jgi:hypothetical protein
VQAAVSSDAQAAAQGTREGRRRRRRARARPPIYGGARAGGGLPRRRRDPGPDGPRAGLRRRSGLGRASGSAQSGRVDLLFFRNIFQCKKTNLGNAQKMFRGTKNTQKILKIPGKFLEID